MNARRLWWVAVLSLLSLLALPAVAQEQSSAQGQDQEAETQSAQVMTANAIDPNFPPIVQLLAPANGDQFAAGIVITLEAMADDTDDGIASVRFLVDDVVVATLPATPPYTANWTVTAGSHTVKASATDNRSKTTTTAAITITGVVVPRPAVPTLTVPATSSTGSYSVSWTTSSNTTHYELGERIGSGSWTVLQDTSATSRSLSGKGNGSYSYRVRACYGTGAGYCSAYSAIGTITVALPPPVPAVPTLTLPDDNDTGSYSATWTSTANATHYEFGERIGSGSWNVIQDTGSTSKGLYGKPTGSYSYRVRACNGAGTGYCSAYSSIKTIAVTIPADTIVRIYTYDAYQQLCRVDEPETGATLMGYDAAGNLAWSASGLAAGIACSSDGNIQAINDRKAVRTYDVRNRVSTLTFPDGNGNQSWTYTPDGLPASVTTYNDEGSSSVINSYLYNHRRLPTGETQQVDSLTYTVGYGYDVNGHLSTLTYPDSLSVAYAPNALGQPTKAGTYATNVTYYPNGAIAGFTYGNGIVHTLTQNARGLPDRSKDANGSTAIHDDSYIYDQVGNVAAIADGVAGNRGDRDMTYDALNRLTQVTGDNGPSLMFGTATYAYDELDNLTHVQVTGGSQPRNQAYVYDGSNRLTNITAGGATVVGLGYDVQGNLSNKNGVLYTFDYGNRLRAGGPETYRYDVQGRRARSSSSAGLVYSLYAQSGQLLFQRDERSGKRRQYVYLGGSLVAESAVPLAGGTATVTYQHTDALGSPVATTNSAKTVLQRSEYEPYGYLLNRPMQDGPGYTGHVTDAATGLVYMQQRYYDPLIGQHFLSVDPVTAYSPGGVFNQYWYADANPYRMVDPDGRRAASNNQCDLACKRRRQEERQRHNDEPYTGGTLPITGQAKEKGDEITQPFLNPAWMTGDTAHDYHIGPTLICATTPICNADSVATVMEWESVPFDQNPVPGQLSIFWFSPIVHYRTGNVSVNITRFGHPFHPGGVFHVSYDFRGYTWLYTRGAGNGSHPGLNAFIGYMLFGKMHQDVFDHFNPIPPGVP